MTKRRMILEAILVQVGQIFILLILIHFLDGSSIPDRVSRYGEWEAKVGENCDYSSATEGMQIIINLLIDDGIEDRGHRK
jgi:hypothetical protein